MSPDRFAFGVGAARSLPRACVLLAAVLAAGCAPPASQGGFDSPNPASQLYAIQRAGEAGDRSAIPKLIESLHSDDPAVRMWAIQALVRLTGKRLEYRPFDPPDQRQAAAEAWADAWREGRLADAADGDSVAR